MANTISPNMNLIVPAVGNEIAPTYAFDVNNSLTLIDGHDHSPGRGVQITPAGLNINTTLTFKDNLATALAGAVFTQQSSAGTTFNELSVAPGSGIAATDLFFTDGSGNTIQITKSGAVNVVASSIPGETYAAGTFIWTQDQSFAPTTPANFDIGSVTIRPNTPATTFGVTLSPNSGISSQYTINLPLLPVSTSFLTINSSGVMAANIPTNAGITGANIASATITGSNIAAATITGSNIAATTITGSNLVNQTITDTQIASNTITGDRMVAATVTSREIEATNEANSTSSGTFQLFNSSTVTDVTNLSVTITTRGRPVMIGLASDGTTNQSFIRARNSSGGFVTVAILQGATKIASYQINNTTTADDITVPASVISTITFPAAGTYTFKVQVSNNIASVNDAVNVNHAILYAYEIL